MKQQVTTYEQTWERNLALAAFKQMIVGLLAAFPDLWFMIEDQVIAGDKVATRWTAEGTHTGPLGEVKPTGTRVRIDGLILDRVVGDRVAERWEQWDQMGMMQLCDRQRGGPGRGVREVGAMRAG